MISPRLAAELLGSTLVNGESNIFLVTRRDNRMLAVVSWHLHNAVFVGNSSSLPAEMGAPPGWFDNFGTVRWGGAGPQSRREQEKKVPCKLHADTAQTEQT